MKKNVNPLVLVMALFAIAFLVSPVSAEFFHNYTSSSVKASVKASTGIKLTKVNYYVKYNFNKKGLSGDSRTPVHKEKNFRPSSAGNGKWTLNFPEYSVRSMANKHVANVSVTVKFNLTQGKDEYRCNLSFFCDKRKDPDSVFSEPVDSSIILDDVVDGLLFDLNPNEMAKQRIFNQKTKKWAKCTWFKNGYLIEVPKNWK